MKKRLIRHGSERRASAGVAAVLAALALVACGGGGDEPVVRDLTLDFTYPQVSAALWRPTSLAIAATGTEGNTPACSITAGTLAAGLSLQANGCTIVGTPTTLDPSTVTIRMTVPGFNGQAERSVTFFTSGPAMSWTSCTTPIGRFANILQAGTPVSDVPRQTIFPPLASWAPGAGETVRYAVTRGELPIGITLDSATGRLHGIPSTPTNANFSITVTASKAGSTVTKESQPLLCDVFIGLQFAYGPADGTSVPVGSAVSIAPTLIFGQQQLASDYTFTNYRASPATALPPGLSIDPVSGQLSGTPTTAQASTIRVLVDVTSAGESATFTSKDLSLTVTP